MRIRRVLFASVVFALAIARGMAGAEGADAGLAAGLDAFNQGNFTLALQQWRQMADAGNLRAQVWVGHMYYGGYGVDRDLGEAIRWYRLASEKGDPAAEVSLGSMYYHGLGVSENLAEAFRWYRLAADQGNADAQYNLGIMYREGQGTSPDLVQAYLWSTLAATQGRPDGRAEAERVAEKMTPSQIAEAEVLLKNYKPIPPAVALAER